MRCFSDKAIKSVVLFFLISASFIALEVPSGFANENPSVLATSNDQAAYLPSVAFDTNEAQGEESNSSANLTVSLSAASGQTVTVNYAVTGGTADGNGIDYTLSHGTLTFNPGDTTRIISATIINDSIQESPETIEVTLFNPVNASLEANPTQSFTILDDDFNREETVEGSQAEGSNSVTLVPGVTPGQFSVNQNGGAEYQVAIAVPPGTAGMQPSLSLNYNSQGGNGILGQGWTLGGLSVITRCPATKLTDGFIDGVDFDDNDRFCIDGQRLIAINGTYGADGTEYRSETDGFTKVISYDTNSSNSGPEQFKAWTKTGQILEYGYSTDSRIEAQGNANVRLWAVNRIEDTVGNYLTVDYTEDTVNGTYRPDCIDYTGNDNASTTPYASVCFEYEDRSDIIPHYFSGSLVKSTKRLTHIKTNVDGNPVRDYSLAYESEGAAQTSHLTSLQECDSSSNCFPATTFEWQETGEDSFEENHVEWENSSTGFGNGWSQDFVDLNGDGLPDLVKKYMRSDKVSGTRILVHLNDGNGFGPEEEWEFSSTGFGEGKWFIEFVDFNGDGLPDLVKNYHRSDKSVGTRVLVYLNNGSSFDAGVEWLNTSNGSGIGWSQDYVDLNGDGLRDLVMKYMRSDTVSGTIIFVYLNNNGTSFGPKELWESSSTGFGEGKWFIEFVDLNGDGLLDLTKNYQRSDKSAGTRVLAYLNNGSSFDAGVQWEESSTGFGNGWSLGFLDLNGDGLPDLIKKYFNPAQSNEIKVLVLLNNGNGFDDGVYWNNQSGYGLGWSLEFVDLNGDGLPDLIKKFQYGPQSAGTRVLVHLNNGSGFDPGIYWDNVPSGFGNGWSLDFVDLNGNGLPDLIKKFQSPAQAEGTRVWVHLNKRLPSGRIDTFTNGMGLANTVEYHSLVNNSIFTKGTGSTYPEIDYITPMQVVSSVQASDGLGGQLETTYFYAGLKADFRGRNYGFAAMTSRDMDTGISTKTVYSQEYPYSGEVTRTEQHLSDGTLIGEVDTQFSHIKTHDGLETSASHTGVLFPYASSSTKKDYEIDGSLVTTLTTQNTYDNFGNATEIISSTTGKNPSQLDETYTTVTKSLFTNDETNWILGRVTSTNVTQYLPQYTGLLDGTCTSATLCGTRESSFLYDPVTGLLKEETVEPNIPELTLTTQYGYDAFGNKTNATVSGGAGVNAIAPRTTHTFWGSHDVNGNFISDGRYPVLVFNTLFHMEYHVFDSRFGSPLFLLGPNNLITSWTYDSFGRQTTENRADGTSTTVTREWCDGHLGFSGNVACPAEGMLALTKYETGAPPSIAYSDKLGRELRVETQGFDGTSIFVDTIYDRLGRVEYKSRPYFEGTPGENVKWQFFGYDALSRVLVEVEPDGGQTIVGYAGLTKTTINALGQQNTQINFPNGKLALVYDADQNVTQYEYDPFGNLLHVTDAAQNVVSNTYDILGRKTSTTDPDMGRWTYEYNALGELILQTDAMAQTVSMEYDVLGRMTKRTEPEGDTLWTYDTAPIGIGKISSLTNPEGLSESYQYDNLGRLRQTTTNIDLKTYTVTQTYDNLGRPEILTYPSSVHYLTGLQVRNVYNAFSYLIRVENANTGVPLWTADTMNAEGQLTQLTYGNGVTTQSGFDPNTGLIQSIGTSSPLGNSDIQNASYLFDSLGNLKQRQDHLQGLSETFGYDVLNRMKTSTLDDGVAPFTKNYTYDALGNLKSKTGIGGYTYGQNDAGPHAVTTAGGQSFTYDVNGNMLSGYNFTQNATRQYTWTSFNKMRHIAQGTTTMDFTYGADRNLIKQVVATASENSTRYYLNGLYEEDLTGGITTHIHFLKAGGQTIGIYKSKSDNSEETRFLHRDHLGSITEITDENGDVVEKLSYDPHGKRRNVNWQDAAQQIVAQETKRCFTGHQYLDDVGLVNMGGRMYDPDLGRFLSPDPHVQEPANPQNLNRYTYVLNNPLSFTDPSGFFFKKIFKAIKRVVKKVVRAVKKVYRNKIFQAISVIAAGYICGPQCAAIASAQNTAINGGSITDIVKSAAIAYASGELFGQSGETEFLSGEHIKKVFAHGTVGGVFSEVGGGEFIHGFASAGVAEFAGPGINLIDSGTAISLPRVFAASVSGGAASALGGGKFANGAVTAAFSRLYKDYRGTTLGKSFKRTEKGINTTVELRHNRILPWLGPLSPTHAYIIVTDHITGIETLFRGGPSGNLFFDGTFGVIEGEFDIFDENAVDFTKAPAYRMIALQSDLLAETFNSQLTNFTDLVNLGRIPYSLLSRNSNSFAYQGLESIGLKRPSNQGFAVGSQTILGY